MGPVANEERDVQRSYWKEHSSEATVEAMMLDSQASVIDKEERPEVLSYLGNMSGKRVLELGAGIGRFTRELAPTAKAVTAVDFMENLIQENRHANGHFGNCEFKASDVMDLAPDAESYDVVFSNWLLMYLGDREVEMLASRMLQWVPEGGMVFFRESCFKQSGDKKRGNNPTHYRNPREYFRIFDSVHAPTACGQLAHFELVSCKCVDTYVRVKHNQNQVCWRWKKVVRKHVPEQNFRQFLDAKQYSNSGILRYERVFGEGFVSTGGPETTQEFVGMLDLAPDQRVLDVGCGIGGGDFYMARQHDVYVHGLDLSVNMVLFALERANVLLDTKVSFEIADVTLIDIPAESFDVIYSRDTLLHVGDKPALFKRFFDWLKPGGRLLISDYCRAPGQPSEEFAGYISQRGYDLHSVEDYGKMIQGAGFTDVAAEDRTWQFEKCLRRELEGLEAKKADFLKDFSEDDYTVVAAGWGDKLQRAAKGEQRWGLFSAQAQGMSAMRMVCMVRIAPCPAWPPFQDRRSIHQGPWHVARYLLGGSAPTSLSLSQLQRIAFAVGQQWPFGSSTLSSSTLASQRTHVVPSISEAQRQGV